MLPANQGCPPLSSHSEDHHTFSSALLPTEPALTLPLASHLGTCEPAAERGAAEPAGAPPLSMPARLSRILNSPVCPCCSLSSGSGTARGAQELLFWAGSKDGAFFDNLHGEIEGPILWP